MDMWLGSGGWKVWWKERTEVWEGSRRGERGDGLLGLLGLLGLIGWLGARMARIARTLTLDCKLARIGCIWRRQF